MIAVILAAGMGNRLHGLNNGLPKGFLKPKGLCFNGVNESLIVRSLRILKECKIGEVWIVAGYCGELYEELTREISNEKFKVNVLWNRNYSMGDSADSFFCAREVISSDFLLLESDILYEKRAVSALLGNDKESVVLCSALSGIDDAVFVESYKERVKNISKDFFSLKSIFGEFVGISKISYGDFLNFDFRNKIFYEELLLGLSVLKISDLL